MSEAAQDDSKGYVEGLVAELCAQPNEASWFEFKTNNADPEGTGKYVSALANSAALEGRGHGYLVWGVEDETHRVVGTTVNPALKKVGNQEFVSWLATQLEPSVHVAFLDVEIGTKRVVVLKVDSARGSPVSFRGL